MANASEQSAVTARTGKPFTFTRKRGNATAEFFPGAGSTLRFANRDTDTLNAVGIPAGLLQAGDTVTVAYLSTTVFQGTVERIVDRHGRGGDRVQDVTCQGPWGKMNRLVFRQQWGTGEARFSSSRVILNQTGGGERQNMADQLDEIVTFAASKCGFAAGTIQADTLVLPADETRDITCADAIRRMLRFHPRRIVRFDYSGSTPELEIVEPSGNDAAYVAAIPKTTREYVYNAHPVSCVDIATDPTDIILAGGASSRPHQIYPVDADPTDLDCLHITIPLAPGSASTTTETFISVTEALPADLNDKTFWMGKHPRLKYLVNTQIEITGAEREPTPNGVVNIAKATKGEIEAAGLKCAVSRFKCNCKIENADETEENIVLTMDFLLTNAQGTAESPRKYTWQTGSSWSAGETLPDGLAKAIYEQRGGALLNERMTIRLGSAFPQLGDMADGLYLQSFDVDLADLTARLEFGQPEHLAVEDLKNLLNGFRQRGYAENAVLRSSAGGGEDEEDDDTPGGIPPIASSEWSPGLKKKTTIGGGTATRSGGGKIVLDSGELDSGEEINVRELKYKDGDGNDKSVKVLGAEDIEFPGGGVKTLNGADGDVSIIGGPGIDVETDGQTIKISYNENKDTSDPDPNAQGPDPCAHPGSDDGGGGGVPAGGGGSAGYGYGDDAPGGYYGGRGVPADGGESHPGDPCKDCG